VAESGLDDVVFDDVVLLIGTTGGGVGRHVRAVASALHARGHPVTVAGPAATDAEFGFTVVGARFAPVDVADRLRPPQDARAVAGLRRLLRGRAVVHAHGVRAGALAALALTGMPGRPPLVVTLHNAPPAGGSRLAVGVYAALERLVARRADAVLGVSPDLEERMRRLGAREVGAALVPAPVTPGPSDPAAGQQVRRELGAGDRPVLLTVGRLAPQKGLELLLDAAALWSRREPAPLVLVAGGGPLQAGLQARVDAERLPVRLLGPRSDVGALLAAADVVVVPSRWEGQPLFVQEALRAGRAVVATATGGTPRVLDGAGVLVPYGDPRALAAAVDEVLDDPGRRSALEDAAARRAVQLPTEDDAADSLVALYGRVRRTGLGAG
jgi:glycosyltransferase involved in cell wall biosynthesis